MTGFVTHTSVAPDTFQFHGLGKINCIVQHPSPLTRELDTDVNNLSGVSGGQVGAVSEVLKCTLLLNQ